MKTALFFGSFNPVHVGHMIIANHVREFTDVKKVWMVVSPHNPLKPRETLANDYERLHLVQLAIGDNPGIEASSIEFKLPKPSYTIDTLTYLGEKYPGREFCLVMGSDNLHSLPKWKNYELLLERYEFFVYQRPGTPVENPFSGTGRIQFLDAPLLDISASFIRDCIRQNRSVQYLLPDAVWNYLKDSSLYRH